VLFTQPLPAGNDGLSLRPGERHRFGVAIFDGTSVNHHVVRDSQIFAVVAPVALDSAQEPAE
jgi:hypothetical protein